MKKWLIVCLAFIGLAAGFACKGSTTPDVKTPPTISSFTATPATIHSGESSTLAWNVSNATTLSINQGVGTVTGATGSRTVSPTATTTYTLTATNADGTKTATCTVTIALNPPTIDSFTATPASIKLNDSSMLSWSVQNATTVSIDQAIGTVAATGTSQVTPLVTTTYTLTATNADGNSTATAQVAILPAADVTLATNPDPIIWAYDEGTTTTTANFSAVFTEINNVGGNLSGIYVGTYLTTSGPQLSSQLFLGGDFAALGTVTIPCAVVAVGGQPAMMGVHADWTDSNGYVGEKGFYVTISWPSGVSQLQEVIPGVTDPRIVRLVEDLKRNKR